MSRASNLIALVSLVTLSATIFASPAKAVPNGWVLNHVVCMGGEISFDYFGPPGSGGDGCPNGVDPSLSSSSPVIAGPFSVSSFVNLPIRGFDVVDVNSLTDPRATDALGLDRATLAAINEVRNRGAFTNAEDFALRVCSKTSVTLRGNAIRVGATEYRNAAPRDPRRIAAARPSPVFSCVAGSGTYEIVGRAHNYVGHVTLLR